MKHDKAKGHRGAVAILGGGIAGMQSALLLAEMGRQVFLLDREPVMGGFFPLLDRTFPTNSCGVCFMSPTPPAFCPIHECRLHERIELIPHSVLTAVEGQGGDFTLSICRKPGFVNPDACNLCGACFEVCPVEREREFGGGLETRKAIYRPLPQSIPPSPVIDPEACTRCGACVRVCEAGAIDLEMREEQETIHVGALILGFGFESVSPAIRGEYGFGRYRNVYSGIQLERMLSTSSSSKGIPVRRSDGKETSSVAFIQCVGSRDPSCGREQCSTVCCMYATKQAMLIRDRCPGTEVTVYYMDMRPMGKGYERYFEQARDKYGIKYRRCAVSAVKELQSSKDLLITSVEDDGNITEDRYGAVVLSTGFAPPRGARETSALLGIAHDAHGFCNTEEFQPLRTTVPGIFVGGAFRGPRDIPQTVVEGSGAASEAAAYLSSQSVVPEKKEYPLEGDIGDEEPRIGLFICRCKGKLDRYYSWEHLSSEQENRADVVHCEIMEDVCSPEGIGLIKERMGNKGINRLVIAGCTPREVTAVFEETAREIGLNASLLEWANIREQCAYVHENDPEKATRKASVLINMAVEKGRRIQPVRASKHKTDKNALVVGAGIAGMTAALGLARQGCAVSLVEKSGRMGGNALELFYTLRGGDPQKLVRDLAQKIEHHGSIHLFKESEVSSFEGSAGNFKATIREKDKETSLKCGAVIVATGAREMITDEYLLGHDDRIITQRALEKLIHSGIKEHDGLKSIAMIQCVGSRSEEHPYCSRVCCGQAVKNALRLKDLDPSMDVYILYRDVRTYGNFEAYYRQAREKGVVFIRYEPDKRPSIEIHDDNLSLSVHDTAIGEEICLAVDRIVLSVGIETCNNEDLARGLNMELDDDRFFKEANPKAAPLDALERGVFFCGLCHSPNYIEDAIAQGMGAAARAATLLSTKEISEVPYTAFVVERLCSGCGLCVTACSYGARSINDEGCAQVDTVLCKGCGSCATDCRNGATRQKNYEKHLTMAVVDAAID